MPSPPRPPRPGTTTPAGASDRPGGPTRLTVNGLERALGVEPDDVYFAFNHADARRGARQRAYRITVSSGGPGAPRPQWDSGTVESARQAFIPYGGPTLAADTTYRWTVATSDPAGRWSPASEPATFVTGLRAGDWSAQWLRPGPGGALPEEYTYVRTELRPGRSPIARATAYVAAAHKYQLWVNGSRVDTGPSFSFPDESYYQATDVTGHLRPGRPNVLGALHHWYSSGSGRPLIGPGPPHRAERPLRRRHPPDLGDRRLVAVPARGVAARPPAQQRERRVRRDHRRTGRAERVVRAGLRRHRLVVTFGPRAGGHAPVHRPVRPAHPDHRAPGGPDVGPGPARRRRGGGLRQGPRRPPGRHLRRRDRRAHRPDARRVPARPRRPRLDHPRHPVHRSELLVHPAGGGPGLRPLHLPRVPLPPDRLARGTHRARAR